MARFAKTLMVVMMSTTLFAANIAEAKRVGGGRSGGMQRQAAPAPQRNNNVQQQPQQQPMAPAQKSGGMGMMGGVLGGLAAGSLLGYMFGHSGNASGTAQGDGGIPWGTLLLLGALTAGGVMWMRRRQQAQAARPGVASGMAYSGAPAQAFPEPAQQDRVFRIGEGAGSAAPVGGSFGGAAPFNAAPITRLPDGTEAAAFLRQARASFMHMQSLNSPSQAEEMRRYMTPELFEDLKHEIGSNSDVAEFPELNLQILEAVNEGGRMIASVEFTGRVSESLHAAPVPFREIWHFVRPMDGDPRWMLAGIQQA